MIRLLNSAVMIRQGSYRIRAITQSEFVRILQSSEWISYIGYPNMSDFISQLIGKPVPVSRASTVIDDGDVLLICRIAYRLTDRTAFQHDRLTTRDVEFLIARYDAGKPAREDFGGLIDE